MEPLGAAEARRKKEILKVTGAALLGGGVGAIALAAAGPAIVAGAASLLPKAGRLLIPKTLKGKAAAITVGGILSVSKKARKATVRAPKTLFESGKTLGAIIEDPKKAGAILGIEGKDLTTKEKIIQGAKKAGLAGAGIAAVVGGVAVGKKIIESKKESSLSKLAGLRDVGITSPKPVGLGGIPIVQASPVLAGRPKEPITQQPIQNIIQIQVS